MMGHLSSFSRLCRSASPRSKDSRVKKERDIKTEEEEDDKKKKEKVTFLRQLNLSTCFCVAVVVCVLT